MLFTWSFQCSNASDAIYMRRMITFSEYMEQGMATQMVVEAHLRGNQSRAQRLESWILNLES
jgi:hypothetical protein